MLPESCNDFINNITISYKKKRGDIYLHGTQRLNILSRLNLEMNI